MKIKFFITPVYPYGDDHYFHEMIALAEGFIEFGYEVCGNVNYWWREDEGSYLIQESNSKDFDLGIYDYRYAASFEHLLLRDGFPNLDASKKHVLVDRNDWISPIWVRSPRFTDAFDLIVAGNLFTHQHYSENIKPWAIGLTHRQMEYIDCGVSASQTDVIAHNFRVGHNLRKLLLSRLERSNLMMPIEQKLTQFSDDEFEQWSPNDRSYYNQSTRRHNPEYFAGLSKYSAYLAFGGYFEYKPFAYQPYSLIERMRRKFYALKSKGKFESGDPSSDVFVFQYDNFRFWEALFGTTCPISLDTEFWNFRLPVQPQSGEHYIGIRQWSIESIEEVLSRLTDAKTIGRKGREWIKEHYSPSAQAQRLINYLDE